MVTLILSFLCAAALLLAVALYYKPFSRGQKWAWPLWTLRFVIVVLLLCAFFEPVLNLRLLAPGPGTITVLLDASKSMRLFKVDSLVKQLVATIPSPSPGASIKTPSLQVYCFGDSLRRCTDAARCPYSDEQSFFPIVAVRETFDQSRLFIIVSDGNWSNPSLPRAVLDNKNCYYLTLPGFSPLPYLHAECGVFQSSVPQDSPSAATLSIQGFKNNKRPLEIVARERGHIVFQTLRSADSGYFSDTVSVRFPTSRPGRYCYVIDLRMQGDSLGRRMYLVGNVVPREFTAAFYSASPTLDRRFLSIALAAGRTWKLDDHRDADALFIFDWDNKARAAFSRLKPSGIAAFFGCLPCSTRYARAADSFSLLAMQPDDTLTRRLEILNMPPPSFIIASTCPALSLQRPVLRCRVRMKTSDGMVIDSPPFLYLGSFGGRSALVLAARDVWKMEFLPLAVDRENETPSFLQYVLAIVQEQLYTNANRTFFVCPAAAELYDQDSGIFNIVLPPGPAQGGESSLGRKISFSMTRNGSPFLDTVFSASGRDASGTQTLRFRPMPAGAYRYTATLFQGASRFVSADTAFVENPDLELSIPGQNTVLLNQFAVSLELRDVKSVVDAAVNAAPGEKGPMRTLTLQLRQSWPLLLALIFLFGLEWLLRRKAGLDL